MNNSRPLVTIGVASFNNDKYILETLESIRNQTYENFELIINDDCSTDSSVSLIKNWISKNEALKVTLIENNKNKGLCNALNNIVKASKGVYISLIASDDIYLPNFIKSRVDYLIGSNENIALCYSKSYLINEKSERIGIEERDYWLDGSVFEELCSLNNSFCKPFTSMVKKSIYDDIGLYDENLIFEDLDFFFRLTKKYDIAYIEKIETEYRIIGNSLSSKTHTSEAGLNSNATILYKQFGHSKKTDLLLANRLRKIAVKKRKIGINNWKKDFKTYLSFNSNYRDRLYLIVFSIFK